jgi:predicted dehydrogenase
MKPITFGLIGTGRMASTMLEAFRLLPAAEVACVHGSSPDHTAAFASQHGIARTHASLDDLLRDPVVDAVYIANANELHSQTCLRAMANGKAVLCEKPIATSAEEASAIQAAASSAGILCMEAMWTLCLPSYRKLFELQGRKTLGEALRLYADFGYPVSARAYPKLFAPGAGAGVLLDRAVYPISLALQLFGPVDKVQSSVIRSAKGVDTHAELLLTHAAGKVSTLAVSFDTLLQNQATLAFTQGTATLEAPLLGCETLTLRAFNAPSGDAAASSGTGGKAKKALKSMPLLRRMQSRRAGGDRSFVSYGSNQYLPMLKHFCDLLSSKRLASDWISLENSVEALRVVDAAKR